MLFGLWRRCERIPATKNQHKAEKYINLRGVRKETPENHAKCTRSDSNLPRISCDSLRLIHDLSPAHFPSDFVNVFE